MSDLEKIKTVEKCDPPCPERLLAVVCEQFGPARVLGGWVFREGPFRELDTNVKWRAIYFDEKTPEDHTGEPYSWTTCPFCGGALPDPPDDEGLEADDGC